MEPAFDVIGIVGSLRRDAYSKRLAIALCAVAPKALRVTLLTLEDLSFYNQDLDSTPPQNWQSFRDRVKRADAVLVVTPEYNRSVPGVLKNALDVGSRPYGHSVWDGKPTAVVSCSPGAVGAFGANHHLRQSLMFLNMPTLEQPEAYIGGVDKLFDDKGNFQNAATREFCATLMARFEALIRRTLPPS